jgi:hypothetical protein
MILFNFNNHLNAQKKIWYTLSFSLIFFLFEVQAQVPCFQSVNNSSVCFDEFKKSTIFIIMNQLSDQKTAETWLNPLYNKLVVKADMLDSFIDADVVIFSSSSSLNNQVQLKKKVLLEWLSEWKINHLLYFVNEADYASFKSKCSINYSKAPGIAVYNPKTKVMKLVAEGAFTEDKMEQLEDYLLED